jgi:hypothetical protein
VNDFQTLAISCWHRKACSLSSEQALINIILYIIYFYYGRVVVVPRPVVVRRVERLAGTASVGTGCVELRVPALVPVLIPLRVPGVLPGV